MTTEGYNASYALWFSQHYNLFYYTNIPELGNFCYSMSYLQATNKADCNNYVWQSKLFEYQSINKYGMDNGGGCQNEGMLYQTIYPIFPGVFYFIIFWNDTIGNQTCYVIQTYNPQINQCVNCSTIFPNCAACTMDACTICNDGYFWNPNYFNQTLGRIAGTCLLDGCPLGYGPIYQTTLCQPCLTPYCDICSYNLSGYTLNSSEFMYEMVLGGGACKRCSKGYRLNSTSGLCLYIQDYNLNINFLVQNSWQSNLTGLALLRSSQFFHLQTNNYSLPFFQLPQVFGVMRQLYENGSYYQLNATIYLTAGDHFFFYCDNTTLDSGSTWMELCTNAYSFISGFYVDNALLYQLPFDTDNIYLRVKPLECHELPTLNFIVDPSQCVDLSVDPKPRLFMNQQWAYFNLSGYSSFENIIFTGQNQLNEGIYLQEPDALMNYFDAQVNPNDADNGFYFNESAAYYSALGGYYTTQGYSYKTITPNDIDTTSKCRQNSNQQFYQQRESLQQCQGEPNHPLFFSTFTNPQWKYTLTVEDITRTFALFNMYAFDQYRSTRNQLPELRLTGCEFQYFLTNYTALITVQNNNFRQRISNFTVNGTYIGTNVAQTFHYYHYYGSDKGIKLYVNNSVFGNSSFCKGLISFQKKVNLTNSFMIADYSTYYTTNQINDTPYIIIYNSTFTNLYAYDNVTALAIMNYGASQTYSFQSERQTLQFGLTTHRGMVLNLNGFQGQVEISQSNILRNKILIPEIIIGEQSLSVAKSDVTFKDEVHFEYKMSICSQQLFQNQYFLDDGFDSTVDLDAYFDYFERLSTIYISENSGNVILSNNKFSQNIGTFGGAVTINSQNWQNINESYIIISNNSFSNNMAYFEGNAIYIRNTRRGGNYTKQCGSAYILNNSFVHNIGPKKHNGGAIAGYCYTIPSALHDDYFYTSEHFLDNLQNSSVFIADLLDQTIQYEVPLYPFTIQNSLFQENFSGSKGTAVYIREMSQVQILNCTFIGNKPTLQQFEKQYSPYYNYLPNRTLSYFNSNPLCSDELNFMINCKNYQNQIDWPYTKGAVYIEHCQTGDCFEQNSNTSNQMQLLIANSLFLNNKACPIMDQYFPTNLATSIYITGGINNTLDNNQFLQDQLSILEEMPEPFYELFPLDYFNLSQSPHIYISIVPLLQQTQEISFNTFLIQCLFEGNRNIQILGIPNNYIQQSALISFITNYDASDYSFSASMSLNNCSFTNNTFKGQQSALIYVYNGLLNIKGSIFTNNGYLGNQYAFNSITTTYYRSYNQSMTQENGVVNLVVDQMLQNQATHLFTDNVFNHTYAKSGSVFYLDIGFQQITMNRNQFNYNFALSGSIIYVDAQSNINNILLNQGSINQNYNDLEGAICIENNDYSTVTLTIMNFQFIDCYASAGGSLYLDSIALLMIANSSFYYDDQTNIMLLLTNSSDFYDYDFLLSITSKQSMESNGNQIYMVNVYNPLNIINPNIIPQYTDNSFSILINVGFYNLYSQTSTLLSVFGSNIYYFNDPSLNVSIGNISQVDQGLISAQAQSIFVGQGLKIQNSITSYSASLFYISDSTLSCTSCQFLNNSANYYGSIYIQTNSWFTCNQCSFSGNHAYDSSIAYVNQNPNTNIIFNNCTFVNNTSFQNLITSIGSNLEMNSCMFLNNIASTENHGITAGSSTIMLTNVIVDYTDENYLNDNSFPTDYGFIQASSESSVTIQQSQFSNTKGEVASVLYSTGSGTVNISNSTFKNCQSLTGGTFSLFDTLSSNFTNTFFANNTQIDIYSDQSFMSVIGSTFSHSQSQSIYLLNSNASIENTSFSNGSNTGVNGKAIYCNCIDLFINNCSFSNLGALEGGAVFLSESSLNSTFSIVNSTFNDNLAQQGGAIYVQDALNLRFENNNFINNSAQNLNAQSSLALSLIEKGLGGAIYLDCFNSALGINKNCNISFEKNNSFLSNQAQNDGGAIKYISTQYYGDNTTLFINNTAYYGNNIASYPKTIRPLFITNRDEDLEYSNSSSSASSSVFPHIVSGTPFYLVLQMLDQEGQIYATDSSSQASLIAINSNQVLLQNFQTIASNGVYNFSELTILAAQNTTVTLSLQVSGVETYSNSISFVTTDLEYSFYLRPCVSGEEYSSNKSCSKCPINYYLLGASTQTSTCLSCPSSAICYGGDQIYPLAQYWRPNRTYDNFTMCQNKDACIGGNDTLNRDAICASGYEGIICGKCILEYQQTSVFTCEQCPQRVKNIVKIALLLTLVILFVIYLVRSSIMNARSSNSAYSVYLKIMVNHLQVILAISNIKYQWPIQIEKFYEGQVKVASYSTQIFSIDCFLKDTGLEEGGFSIFFQKLLLYGVLPFVMIIASMIFWAIVVAIRGDISKYKQYFISTITILMFLIHPDIAQIMLTAFNCITVDGINYLRQDVSNICYQGRHLTMIFSVVLPALILWGFGIPTSGFIVLVKNRRLFKKMDRKQEDITSIEQKQIMNFKLKYGFLFNGFISKFYFWEIIIVYRKIGIIMTTVFLSTISQTIQIWAALLVVFISLLLQIHFMPYYTHTLNRMEGFSLLVQTSTLYSGLFYMTEENDYFIATNWLKWLFLFILIIPNLIFFFYWGFFISFEILKEIHMKSRRLFNIVVCGLVDYEKFYMKHMSNQDDEQAQVVLTQTLVAENDQPENKTDRKLLKQIERSSRKKSKSSKKTIKKQRNKQESDSQDDNSTSQRKMIFEEVKGNIYKEDYEVFDIGFGEKRVNAKTHSGDVQDTNGQKNEKKEHKKYKRRHTPSKQQ